MGLLNETYFHNSTKELFVLLTLIRLQVCCGVDQKLRHVGFTTLMAPRASGAPVLTYFPFKF